MPSLHADVVTVAEVELSPQLKKKLRKELVLLREHSLAIKAAQAAYNTQKDAIESVFADAGEYAVLEEGVRVSTPFGEVPLKIIGGVSRSLNKTKLMKKFKLTPADLDSVTDEKKKKSYLGVWLPKEQDDTDEDES